MWFMEPMSRCRQPSTRRVLMNFMCRRGYHISFLEEDCRTTLRRTLTFASADKILEMYDRWGDNRSEAGRKDLMREIAMGRPGGVWLVLTEEQYQTLNR